MADTIGAESQSLRFDNDDDWQEIAAKFQIRPGTTFLNHGSFGMTPDCVRQARRRWMTEMDEQPMDFFVRQYETHVERVASKLAQFVGTQRSNLVFVDNATYGMNVVAESFTLNPGDQVLLNDHEYGAVLRIWERKCRRSGAKLVTVSLPEKFESKQQLVDSLFAQVTEKTRLIVVSHITSATATTFPVEQICRRAKENGIAVCIDGPHALAQLELNIDQIECDFYTASCHKWLCSTQGTGFLYAHPRWHKSMEPINKSWGRLLPAIPEHWTEEFTWLGTRDISAFLSIETAIDFMQNEIGLSVFRRRSHYLARDARQQIEHAFDTQAIMPDGPDWYVSMAHVPLPKTGNDLPTLQDRLWQEYGIEVPIIDFNDRWFIRVSMHLYNSSKQIEDLVRALRACL